MDIKLTVFSNQDLEVQAQEILDLLEQGRNYKEIKKRMDKK